MSEKIKKEEIEQRIVEFLAGIGFIFVMVIAFGLVHFAIFGVVSIVPAPKDKWFVKFALAFPEFSPGYVMSLITYLIGQFVPEFWRTKADTKMLHSQMTKVAGQMGEMTERLERLPDQIPIRVLTSTDEILREITLAASVCETVTFLGNCKGDYIDAIKASQNQKLTGVICDTAPDKDSFDKVRDLNRMLYKFLPVLSPTDFGPDIFAFRGANRQPKSLLVFRGPDPNRVSAVWLPGDVCELLGLQIDNFPKISIEIQINQQIPHIRNALEIIRNDLLLKVTDGYWHPVILLSGPDFWEEQIFRAFVETASQLLRDGTTRVDITWDFTNLSTLEKAEKFKPWFDVLNSPKRKCHIRRIIFVSSEQWRNDRYQEMAKKVYTEYIIPGEYTENYEVRIIDVSHRSFNRPEARDVAIFHREGGGFKWVQDSTYFEWGQSMQRLGLPIDPKLRHRRILLIYFCEETNPRVQKLSELFEKWWSDSSLIGARHDSLEAFERAIRGGNA